MPKRQDYFWLTVNKTDTCWLWFGTKYNKAGYGSYMYEGKQQLAHRVSWQMYYGHIPDNLIVCHSCDNPACVRPDHLFLGTHKTNAEDRENKNRGNRNKSISLFCKQGHEYTKENTLILQTGKRKCKQCIKNYNDLYNLNR